MSETRCRFAPAPTGHLHIGGARTALFNWLYTRSTGGKFILRVEDTDAERNDPEAVKGILEGLQWLGIEWDEGPIYQSERGELYRGFADELLVSNRAYEETTEKGTALRFRMPREDVTFEDIVHGPITFPSSQMDDLVIMKSNGSPTYNFACVVDDHDMRITHVIRGDDHIANTPKQIALCSAFGWDPPLFAHVPMIHGEDGSKLSKRHGASSALEFRGEGYLPEALVNFIALLGWSPGEDRELISIEDMIAVFSLDRIRKTSAVFNREKLDWMNAEYVKRSPEKAAEALADLMAGRGFEADKTDTQWLAGLIGLYSERMKRLTDVLLYGYFFFEDVRYDEAAVEDILRKEGMGGLLRDTADRLEGLESWSEETIEEALRGFAKEQEVKFGALGQPIRVAVTGGRVSPGIFATLSFLGREKTVSRLRTAAEVAG